MTDRDPLSDLLSQWRPQPTDAPDFARGVHARLARQGGSNRVARILNYPAALPLAASIAIMLGVTAALSANRTQTQERMAAAYARSIDPLQMAGHPAPQPISSP